MTETFDIELTMRTDSASGADDTAGHGLQPRATTQIQGLFFRLAPHAAIRLTLPDPAPEPGSPPTRVADVQGFMMMERLPEKPTTAEKSEAPWYGGLILIGKFVSDPYGTVAGALKNSLFP